MGFYPYPSSQERSKNSIEDFTTKVLIPLGSILVGAFGLWASTSKLPTLASWLMGIYLVTVLVIILSRPVKVVSSNVFTGYNRRQFAKKRLPDLRELVTELIGLLEDKKVNSLPLIIAGFSSKLYDENPRRIGLDCYLSEMNILSCWAIQVGKRINEELAKGFTSDAEDFTTIVFQFSMLGMRLRQAIINGQKRGEAESREPYDLKPDWDSAAHRISEFMTRVEKFATFVNEKFGRRVCPNSFQEVKPL